MNKDIVIHLLFTQSKYRSSTQTRNLLQIYK